MIAKVVLTGGPCAGKTSCLRAISTEFAGQVLTLPETATLLLGSGLPPPGHDHIHCPPGEWLSLFQGAILSIQREMEAAFERLARHCRARLLVRDRGVLDGAAYWPGGRDAFLRHFGHDLAECFARYQAVLHLPSLAEVDPERYGRSGNRIRFEPLEEARQRERAVRAAWDGHPGWKVIAEARDLDATVAQVLGHVRDLLGSLS